jgi:hypothetical protein
MIEDPEVRRQLSDLLQGRTTAAGSFALATGAATTTTVTRIGVSSNSVILTTPYSALASSADIVRIVPAKEQFVVTHTASASARTHRYVCLTGLAT